MKASNGAIKVLIIKVLIAAQVNVCPHTTMHDICVLIVLKIST